MTAPKKDADALRDAFVAAPIAAEAARVIGVDGKRFRSHLRSKLGAYASKGNGWQTLDAKQREEVFAHFVK